MQPVFLEYETKYCRYMKSALSYCYDGNN